MTQGDVHYDWNRTLLFKASIIGGLCAAVSAAMGVYFALESSFALNGRALFAALFFVWAMIFALISAAYVAEILRSRPAVRFNAAGLCDPRISSRSIPGAQVKGILPVQNGMQLMLAIAVETPSAIAPPERLVWRFNRRCARLVGDPEIVIRITGLHADLFHMAEAIAAYQNGSSQDFSASN